MRPVLAITTVFTLALAGSAGLAQSPKVGERFGDWVFTCKALSSEQTVCALTQTVTVKAQQGRGRILTLLLRRLEDQETKRRKIILLALLPLGIYLPTGVAARIDQGPQFPLQLRTCTQTGCEAAAELVDKTLGAFKAGNQLFIGFKTAAKGKVFTIPASLKGVTKGLEALP